DDVGPVQHAVITVGTLRIRSGIIGIESMIVAVTPFDGPLRRKSPAQGVARAEPVVDLDGFLIVGAGDAEFTAQVGGDSRLDWKGYPVRLQEELRDRIDPASRNDVVGK